MEGINQWSALWTGLGAEPLLALAGPSSDGCAGLAGSGSDLEIFLLRSAGWSRCWTVVGVD